ACLGRPRHEQRPNRRPRVRRADSHPRARDGGVLARGRVPRVDSGAEAVIAQTRAELLKIRSTRTTLGLVAGMVALVLLFGLLTGLLSKTGRLAGVDEQRNLLDVGSIAGLFSALAGILLVTSEYRYGTIRPTFLFQPRRTRVVAAKLGAGVIAGLLFAIVAQALAATITYVCLSSRGIDFVL